MSFKITRDPIDLSVGLTPRSGARVAFEGVVRCHNHGREVLRLEYEAFAELAEQVGDRVIREAREKYDVTDLACVHRTGELEIGDTAVKIEATAEHRHAAFAACQYVIEELKRRVPIWKREVYADGKGEWLHAEPLEESDSLSEDENQFYARQLSLPWVGEKGQKRIKCSSVLVVGAGGLGCPALQYLVGAGVGRIAICDHDIVDVSNLHRQPLFGTNDIGRKKAHLAAEKLRGLNPNVAIEPLLEAFTRQRASEIVKGFDVVLDCTDDMPTKFAINDACVNNRVSLVQASVFQNEGQISSWSPGMDGGCLRCQWPDETATYQAARCKEVGTLGPVPGVLGTLQAWEALQIIVHGKGTLSGSLYLFDLARMEGMKLTRPVRKDCPICREAAIDRSDEIAVLVTTMQDLLKWTIVDVRNEHERRESELPLCDTAMTEQELVSFSSERPPLLVCEKGVNGLLMASRLRAAGKRDVAALIGGRRTLQAIARNKTE